MAQQLIIFNADGTHVVSVQEFEQDYADRLTASNIKFRSENVGENEYCGGD